MKNKMLIKYSGLYGALVFLAFLRAVGTYMFIVPNGFAPGGISGISSIIYNMVLPFNENLAETWLNPAVTVFVLNVPLILWAFKTLDKQFTINTMLCVGVFSFFMGLFSLIDFPQFIGSTYESGTMLLASIFGGVILGLCLGFMLRMNMSLGGTDIIGKVIYKKNPVVDVQWIIFMCDCFVVILSGVLGFIDIKSAEGTKDIMVRILSPVLYSFISLYISSKAADFVQTGFESSVVFNIVTSYPKEMGEAIIEKVKRGATVVKGEGIFTHQERTTVICVVRRKQILPMKRLIKEIDPKAFLYITNAREVNGFGFHPFN